jgi:hypothetical protein
MQLKINTKTLAAGVAMAALSFASAASAGTVVIQNIQGVWSSATPTGTVNTSGNTSTVSWGTPSEGTMKSSYAFTSAASPFSTTLNDGQSAGPFTIGTFQHNNWPVTGTTLEGVTLTVSGQIVVEGVTYSFNNLVYGFTHVETPNDGDKKGNCALGGKTGQGVNLYGCADKVVVDPISTSQTFVAGNNTYTLDLAGFLVGNTLTDSFITKESKVRKYGCGWFNLSTCYDYTTYAQSNTADIQAKISMVTSAVPEPSTWAMMIVGFGAAGAMVRSSRRRGALAA